MPIPRSSFLAAALTASLFLAAAQSIAQSAPPRARSQARAIHLPEDRRIERSARHQHRNRGPT